MMNDNLKILSNCLSFKRQVQSKRISIKISSVNSLLLKLLYDHSFIINITQKIGIVNHTVLSSIFGINFLHK